MFSHINELFKNLYLYTIFQDLFPGHAEVQIKEMDFENFDREKNVE